MEKGSPACRSRGTGGSERASCHHHGDSQGVAQGDCMSGEEGCCFPMVMPLPLARQTGCSSVSTVSWSWLCELHHGNPMARWGLEVTEWLIDGCTMSNRVIGSRTGCLDAMRLHNGDLRHDVKCGVAGSGQRVCRITTKEDEAWGRQSGGGYRERVRARLVLGLYRPVARAPGLLGV